MQKLYDAECHLNAIFGTYIHIWWARGTHSCHFNIYEPDISNPNFLELGINVQTNTVMFHRPDSPMANFLARRT